MGEIKGALQVEEYFCLRAHTPIPMVPKLKPFNNFYTLGLRDHLVFMQYSQNSSGYVS